ncbi:MAG: sulfite exporter TauE/SafE family protein [Chloroflexi bacterium]|nr:sulfite exporter TauE/SafE family protein [Chloroflexota bacterium]
MGDIIVALVIGFVGGFAGGLLGIGGGAIYVPALVLVMDEQQQLAQGVSLAAIIATAAVGSLTHMRRGNVHGPTVLWVAPVAAAAAFGAAFLADALDAAVLRRIFAVVVVYFALTMIVGALRSEKTPVEEAEQS